MSDRQLGLVQVVMLIIAAAALGWYSFLAWLRPAEFRAYLSRWGRKFRGWPLGMEKAWTSDSNFWITRLLLLIFFVLLLGMIVVIGRNALMDILGT